jgi:FkbM family methyltransferase
MVHPRLIAADLSIEPHVIRWIEEQLRPGEIYFDVGAHYGFTALAACRRAGATGRVIAFEPSPPLQHLLAFHRTANRARNLEILGEAVCDIDSAGLPFFLVNRGMSFRNSLTTGAHDTPYLTPADKSEVRVPATRLDTFCANRNIIPALVKIDVEGAEFAVLRGAENLLSTHHPKLIVAVHPPWMPRRQGVPEVLALLRGYGYSVREEIAYAFDNAKFADYLCA